MKKTLLSIGIIAGIIVLFGILSLSEQVEIKQESKIKINADVIMPTKVSRPGCEKSDSCYVPTLLTIKQGDEVTWLNEDVAFHSVTSGVYDSPSEFFDSGHLDPQEQFTVKFEESGSFDYFCTLHPWMAGKVIVQ